ncbi:MAG: hypothetical protein WCQ72_03890 [Eubacteriales bacterium]
MDVFKKPPFAARFMCIAACAAAVAASAANIVVMLRYYESSVNLYVSGSVIPSALNIAIAAVAAVLLCSGLFVGRGRLSASLAPMSQFAVFASGLCGFLCAATAVMRVYEYVTGAFSVKTDDVSTIFACIAALLAIPACIYFISQAVSASVKRTPHIITGFFVIIWGALTLVSAYFDMTTPLNSPPRILNQIACIALMIYMLYELRYPLGAARPRHFLSFGCASIFILTVNGISTVALTFFGMFTVGYQTVLAIFQIAMAIYILSRELSLVGAPEDTATAESDAAIKKKAPADTAKNA